MICRCYHCNKELGELSYQLFCNVFIGYDNIGRRKTFCSEQCYNEYVKQYVEDALIKAGLPIEALTKAEIDIIFDSLIIPDNPSEACSKLPNAYESNIGYFNIDNFDTTGTLTVTLTEVTE